MLQLIYQNAEFAVAGLAAVALFALNQNKPKDGAPLTNAADELALAFLSLLPLSYTDWLQKNLSYAGYHSGLALSRLASFKLYPAAAAVMAAIVLPPAILAAVIVMFFFAADIHLLLKAKKRQSEISAALPQAIDLMLLCVDAGLSLDATMQRIAGETGTVKNALNEELAKLGKDILLGMDRESAYQELYRRTGVEDLKSFTAALNQSSKMGLSISKILRAQSQFIMLRQSQRAEEKAARLPIWMAFPLWFCIMPSLMLVLLGPSLLNFLGRIARP